ncbi:hypothetical protein [Acinetobacter baumannii]|uniref:hypothetical protein n=1 Tax=Acinetobacter baumannii TaxID=470 RepID=UPI0038918EA0
MKPEQLIREFGVEKAREVVEGAPDEATLFFYDFDEDSKEVATCYYKDSGYQAYNAKHGSWAFIFDPQKPLPNNLGEWIVNLSDLKRLVDSLDQITRLGGLPKAKDHLNCMISYGSEFGNVSRQAVNNLQSAIRDHESIYGGGDE